METLKVFGKFKRKELSFDVRGVNNREERLLKNALGSLEKQRKRSLNNIQNEVQDLHITLKETNNVWQGDRHLVQEQFEIQVPKLQTLVKSDTRLGERLVEKQGGIKENLIESLPNQKGMF